MTFNYVLWASLRFVVVVPVCVVCLISDTCCNTVCSCTQEELSFLVSVVIPTADFELCVVGVIWIHGCTSGMRCGFKFKYCVKLFCRYTARTEVSFDVGCNSLAAPRCPKMAPTWPQDSPKMAQDEPKMGP